MREVEVKVWKAGPFDWRASCNYRTEVTGYGLTRRGAITRLKRRLRPLRREEQAERINISV